MTIPTQTAMTTEELQAIYDEAERLGILDHHQDAMEAVRGGVQSARIEDHRLIEQIRGKGEVARRDRSAKPNDVVNKATDDLTPEG